MRSIRDDVSALVSSGRTRADLSAHVRNWRQYPTLYTIENAIRLAADEGRGDDLHDTILDEEFRRLRQRVFGVNALRADLHIARTYSLMRRPDLVRYVQVLLLEQRPFGTPESTHVQQQHCRELAEFLQIDRLPHERLDTGLHKVLGRFFTATSATALRLAGYELGEWNCSCGQLTGLARRYDHTCPCTAVSGHGRITEATPGCPDPTCAGSLDYVVCPSCRTRVTLANLWQVRRGGAGPNDFLLPLTLDLVVEDEQGPTKRASHLLMHLPLPIGLRERNGEIVFNAPTVFWTSPSAELWYQRPPGDRFLGLKDALRYDGRTELRPILEALLRRTLLGYRQGYAQFADELRQDVIAGRPGQTRPLRRRPWTGSEYRSSSAYTRGFWSRLQRVTVRDLALGDLVSRGAVSAQCTVVVSPSLRGRAALVNERLADPDGLSIPTLVQVSTTLPDGAVLTSRPPIVAPERASSLGKEGLITPGSPVRPGQLLVGAASPVTDDESLRTPEERLLYAVFGDEALRKALLNRSLEMPGRRPGHVLAQRISGALATDAIPAVPGRHLRGGGSGTRITVTVAVDQPVQQGDTLDDESGASAVVCGLAGGPSLRRLAGSPDEPDLVVAPDHPWAPPPGETGHTIRIRLAAHGLAGPDTGARSAGDYSLVLDQPLSSGAGDSAQMIEPREFQWLLAHGARHLAMEIYGPRGDCPDWRNDLRTALEEGGRALGPPHHRPVTLLDSPAHAIRRLDATLRAGRVVPRLEADRIGLRLMTDADVARLSHGEVVSEVFYNMRTRRPWPGGLFCQQIFGQDREDECVCGERRRNWDADATCDACGRTPTMPHERGRRLGHIELPVPVVHSWCLGGPAGARLARSLRLTEQEVQQLADCELVLVTDPGPTALTTGQLLSVKKWGATAAQDQATAVTGGQAVNILLRRAGGAIPSGLSPDTVTFQMLPVLPPDLRPHVIEDHRTIESDLNSLYSAVLSKSAQLRRLNDLGAPMDVLMGARRLLQRKVSALLNSGRQPEPTRDANGRQLVSLADSLMARPRSTGTLRDDFLRRPVDYSARARLVIAKPPNFGDRDTVPDPEAVFLGRDLALHLVEPLLVHALISTATARQGWEARAMIEEHAEEAMRLLDAVCEQALILVALPHGPWPLVALRVQAAEVPALQVQPGLLDLAGWKNLGETVRIFSVLTTEAIREATGLLTVDALRRAISPRQPTTLNSFFDLPCGELGNHIADTALATGSLPLKPDDGLLLCDPTWLAERTGEHRLDGPHGR
ncbi:hypothetical protein ACFVYE_44565 [Streptomyces sp. NPDC058239]|uniref:hypothetical protein n=1 Tax=Streptomyces sp. NPDC058239 TaxID=3346395 RepID=UPI0036F0164D